MIDENTRFPLRRYHLPFPPSLNNLFANVPGRGRFPSKRYKQWQKVAAAELQLQLARPVTGAVEIVVELCPPDKRDRDSDNYLKAPIDALVKAGVLTDDSRAHVVSSKAVFVQSGPPCVVTLSPVVEARS